jgi:two-component system NtrC family sensor kinase
MLKRLIDTVQGAVRYKLLVLVLLPILLFMPVALALSVYWGANFTYDQLFIKVNTDLSVANDIFDRIRQDYLNRLDRLAESYAFQTALESGDAAAIQKLLADLKRSAGFSYLHVIDREGYRLYEGEHSGRARLSSSLTKALQGLQTVGVEIFTEQDLKDESPLLARTVLLPLLATPHARPTNRKEETSGMMIRTLYPVKNSRGEIIVLLDGGVLLNGNFTFVDTIRDLVYGQGSLPRDSIGTVTVFLDDVRISTNVPLAPGERALGTRVSDEVRTRVMDQGKNWIDRAFVVNDWYISAYEPIVDVDGKRVGMLYAGFLERPFRVAFWKALGVLGLMLFAMMAFLIVVSVRGAKTIFKPLEKMSDVVRATRDGQARRIGNIASHDEIGELAREFDAMLDLLQERNAQIQNWANELEDKVTERTSELVRKNSELRRTIKVLRETRQQLVVAEKLAALGELTAGVAHEINNPTQVLLGSLDILVAELGPDSERVSEEIDLMIQQVYRIQEIINSLLQYARPGEYSGYLNVIDINTLIRDTLNFIQHMPRQAEYELFLKLEATYPIRASQQEIQQVMVNLVVNAIHALKPDGGMIEISSRDWEDKGVAVSVRDNGVGMDEDQLGLIFNPFYSTKNQGEGTGLGLSVSYSLVRRYGGNITVTSQKGVGTEFCVWLLREPEFIEDEETISEQLFAIEDMAENIAAGRGTFRHG